MFLKTYFCHSSSRLLTDSPVDWLISSCSTLRGFHFWFASCIHSYERV